MITLVITLDLDWTCEAAIEETLEFFISQKLRPTVFTTHPSQVVEKAIGELEVGLHPYFDHSSSQGSTIGEIVSYVTALPHTLPAFRCHRFGSCNQSMGAMVEAGMKISSNVCTDLQVIPPFRNRFGIWEVPIFFEDGGYLWRGHSLEDPGFLLEKMVPEGEKVVLLHPMHFVLNTPHFAYMREIKNVYTRQQWRSLERKELDSLRWKRRGIRDLFLDLLQKEVEFLSLKDFIEKRGGF